MDNKPIFILGLGVQKAGTTWVHSYLRQYDEVNFGRMKEYHIWDALNIGTCSNFKINPNKAISSRQSLIQFLMQNFSISYWSYFRRLVQKDSVRITGDITPSYSGLSKDRLDFIRHNLALKNFNVKFIFLVKDPVERCWSAVRMKRRNQERIGEAPKKTEEAELSLYYKTKEAAFRTDYVSTLTNIESVFKKEDCFLATYESLFTNTEITRLSNFLGVKSFPSFSTRKTNISKKLIPYRQILLET